MAAPAFGHHARTWATASLHREDQPYTTPVDATIHCGPRRPEACSAHVPQTPSRSARQRKTVRHNNEAPVSVSAGQGPFLAGVAGEGFEPS